MSARTTVAAVALLGAVGLTFTIPQAQRAAAPADPDPAPTPTAIPQGEIAEPITSHKPRHRHHRKGWLAPAISSHSKPPREPRLTMPPTDTER